MIEYYIFLLSCCSKYITILLSEISISILMSSLDSKYIIYNTVIKTFSKLLKIFWQIDIQSDDVCFY